MYKVVIDGYIISISEKEIGEAISESEEREITNALKKAPKKDGYNYKLRNDNLQFDEFENPTDEEATVEDYEAALAELGVKEESE